MVERLWAGWRIPAMMDDREAAAAGIADSSGTIPGTVPGAGTGPDGGYRPEPVRSHPQLGPA